MRNILKQSFMWFIIVGCIAWAVAVFTGNALPSFVTEQHIEIGSYTTTLYKIDVHNYLKQMENIVVNFPYKESYWEFPKMPKVDINIVANMLILWIKVILWWGNILILMPIKILLQPTLLFITALGIDINSNNTIKFIYRLYSLDFSNGIQYI